MAEYNFLNDITKFGNSALSAANTLQRQVRAWVTEQVEYLIKSADLVTHDEVNEKFAALESRIAELEKQLGTPAKKPATAAPKAKKPAAKKVAAKKAD